METEAIQLTKYSHGAGCGCKIAPAVLDQILQSNLAAPDHQQLLVGNHSKDDAAVYDLGNGSALISTTDFFMPIVDDPYTFGRIAAANAISDVYAMGGKPVLAIAILGWPVNKLSPGIAQQVVEGGRSTCAEAGIPLAGGHSIDSPEPIFGLAVNGLVPISNIKQNNTAKPGDLLFLTKPIGIGILTTAEKKGLLDPAHKKLASDQMMQLNKVGEELGKLAEVNAMTDVTGFGLLGHLTEMAEGSDCSAVIFSSKVPLVIANLKEYISKGAVPGGTYRNWDSYGEKIDLAASDDPEMAKIILSDPQTSGGLLVACDPKETSALKSIFYSFGLTDHLEPVGEITIREKHLVTVK